MTNKDTKAEDVNPGQRLGWPAGGLLTVMSPRVQTTLWSHRLGSLAIPTL